MLLQIADWDVNYNYCQHFIQTQNKSEAQLAYKQLETLGEDKMTLLLSIKQQIMQL